MIETRRTHTLKNPWFHISLLFLTFNVITAGIWLWQSRQRQPTRLIRAQPERLDSLFDPLILSFDRDLIAPDGQGDLPSIDQFDISPQADLHFNWKSPRTLEVRAKDGFQKAHEYRLKLKDNFLDRDGYPLQEGQSVTFRTPELHWLGLRQIAYSKNHQLTLALKFDDRINLEKLDTLLDFSNSEGQSLEAKRLSRQLIPVNTPSRAYQPQDRGSHYEAHYRLNAQFQKQIFVNLAPGLVGVSGPLGIYHEQKKVLNITSGLSLRRYYTYSEGPNEGSLRLNFGMRIDPEQAKPFFSFDPPVKFSLNSEYSYLKVRGNFQPGKRYLLKIAPGLQGTNGRFLASQIERTLDMPNLSSTFSLVGEGKYLVTDSPRELMLRTINTEKLKIKVQKIFPNNILQMLQHHSPVGYTVGKDHTVEIANQPNKEVFTRVRLDDLLGDDHFGPYQLSIKDPSRYWSEEDHVLTLSQLGIHSRLYHDELLVWVNDLVSAQPKEAVKITVISNRNQILSEGWTDSTGLLKVAVDREGFSKQGKPLLITAEYENDMTYLSLTEGKLSTQDLDLSGNPYPQQSYEAFVYTERNVIRPGEKLHLRGLVRDTLGRVAPRGMPLEWEISRPDSQTLPVITKEVSEFGTTEFQLKTESFFPTGKYRARLKIPDENKTVVLGSTSFRVEEYLPVTLKVDLELEDQAYSPGDTITLKVRGEHLFGGAAKGLKAKAKFKYLSRKKVFKGYEGVRFSSFNLSPPNAPIPLDALTLDEDGRGEFKFQLPSELKAHAALEGLFTVEVFEVSGRAITRHQKCKIDPSPWYLGVRRIDTQKLPEVYSFDCLALRADLQAITRNLQAEAQLFKVTWNHKLEESSGRYRWISEKVEEKVSKETIPLTDGQRSIDFKLTSTGEYRLELRAIDPELNWPLQVSHTFHTFGHSHQRSGSLEIPSRITLTPDKKTYASGETVKLSIESPYTGEALLTFESNKLHETRQFQLNYSSSVIEFPFPKEMIPHGYVTLTVLRGKSPVKSSEDPSLDSPQQAEANNLNLGIPLRAYGAVALERSKEERQTSIDLEVSDLVQPGKTLDVRLQLKDHSGEAVDGEVAIAFVDAGILALTPFELPDPSAHFNQKRALKTRVHDLYEQIIADPEAFLARADATPGGGSFGSSRYLNPIQATRVRSVSLWKSGLIADAQGQIQTSIQAPDFDGELVLIAVHSGTKSTGATQKSIKVRRPIIIQPSWPRFLAPGDAFEVPVTVHNRSPLEVEGQVHLELNTHLKLRSASKSFYPLRLKPEASKILRFQLVGTQSGVAQAKVIARLSPLSTSRTSSAHTNQDSESSASIKEGPENNKSFDLSSLDQPIVKSIEFPLRPTANRELQSEVRIVKDRENSEFQIDKSYLSSTVETELVLSSSLLPSIEGSMSYLLRYPYGCVEQTSSRLLPWIVLKQYLDSGNTVAKTETEIEEHLHHGVERLFSMQTSSGGLAYWPGQRRASNFGSIYAASVLLEIEEAGFPVGKERLDKLYKFLEKIVLNPKSPKNSTFKHIGTLKAFALEVLARKGKAKDHWIQNLLEREEELPLEARCKLQIAKLLNGIQSENQKSSEMLSENPFNAEPKENSNSDQRERELSGTLYSQTRELSILLGTLCDLGRPANQILPLIHRLLKNQKKGRYRSTQEDAFALLAIAKASRRFPAPSNDQNVILKIKSEDGAITEENITVGKGRTIIRWPLKERHRLSPGATLSIQPQEGEVVYAFWKASGIPDHSGALHSDGLQLSKAGTSKRAQPSPAIQNQKDSKSGAKKASFTQPLANQENSDGSPDFQPTQSNLDELTAERSDTELMNTEIKDSGIVDQGLKIRRAYFDRNLSPIKSFKNLTQGQSLIVQLTLNCTQATDNVVIVDKLPAGFEIENPAFKTSDGHSQGSRNMRVFRKEVRDDRLIIFAHPRAGESTFKYVARAVTVGEFNLPRTEAECMYDSELRSSGPLKGKIKISQP